MATVFEVKLVFEEPLLGTAPLNKELYRDYVATKAPVEDVTEEEIATIEETMEKGTTGFHRLPDGTPFLYDYIWIGFAKDACGMMRRVPESESSKLKAYLKQIEGLLFVKPRRIPIQVVGEVGILERPLRAKTAQGERICLARSEMVVAGSSIQFQLHLLGGDIKPKHIVEWLDYGQWRGLGAWRGGGWGRYSYTFTPLIAD